MATNDPDVEGINVSSQSGGGARSSSTFKSFSLNRWKAVGSLAAF